MSKATIIEPDESDYDDAAVYNGDEDLDGYESCPICGERFNHVVRNGYRNSWPALDGQRVTLCTDDRPVMFVHVVDIQVQAAREAARIESEQRHDREQLE